MRTVNVHFLVVPYENAYNGILGRSFMETLDVMASKVHMKMKYYSNSGKLIVITDDLCGALLTHKTILKNPINRCRL